MARKVVHVALNGVTGRMGYRQHLVRSLLAIREQGGIALDDGTSLYPEPVLVGRSEEQAARDRRAARPVPLDHQPGRGARRPGRRRLLRHPGDQRPGGRAGPRDRGRQARLHGKAGGRLRRRRVRAGRGGPGGGHHPRRGAGQAVPARHDQAAQAGPRGLLRPGAVGPARVRLLGVRRGRVPGAAPLVELPRGRRRRHRARHVPALALPPGGAVRPGHRGLRAARDAPAQALGRGGRALRRDRRRRRLRGARVRRRRHRLGELLLGGPRQPPRAARAAGGRHPRQRGGRPAQLRRAAQGVHPDAGVEPRPARPARLPGDVDRRAGQRGVRQRLQGAVGAVPAGRRARGAVPVGPVRRGPGRPAGRAGGAVVGRGPARRFQVPGA